MSTWQTVMFIRLAPKLIPRVPGVYAIECQEEGIVYVGSSQNLRQRFRSHYESFGGCYPYPFLFRFSVSRRRGDWLTREYRLIDRLQPKLNKRGKRVPA